MFGSDIVNIIVDSLWSTQIKHQENLVLEKARVVHEILAGAGYDGVLKVDPKGRMFAFFDPQITLHAPNVNLPKPEY